MTQIIYALPMSGRSFHRIEGEKLQCGSRAEIWTTTPNIPRDYLPCLRCFEVCQKCGQFDHGQTGEYPCSECGLPVVWDEALPAALPADAVRM